MIGLRHPTNRQNSLTRCCTPCDPAGEQPAGRFLCGGRLPRLPADSGRKGASLSPGGPRLLPDDQPRAPRGHSPGTRFPCEGDWKNRLPLHPIHQSASQAQRASLAEPVLFVSAGRTASDACGPVRRAKSSSGRDGQGSGFLPVVERGRARRSARSARVAESAAMETDRRTVRLASGSRAQAGERGGDAAAALHRAGLAAGDRRGVIQIGEAVASPTASAEGGPAERGERSRTKDPTRKDKRAIIGDCPTLLCPRNTAPGIPQTPRSPRN